MVSKQCKNRIPLLTPNSGFDLFAVIIDDNFQTITMIGCHVIGLSDHIPEVHHDRRQNGGEARHLEESGRLEQRGRETAARENGLEDLEFFLQEIGQTAKKSTVHLG
jgi:hypothetical protein